MRFILEVKYVDLDFVFCKGFMVLGVGLIILIGCFILFINFFESWLWYMDCC